MPEGPEVKTIALQLHQAWQGQELRAVEVLGGRYQRHTPPVGLASVVLPKIIDRVECHGKFIYVALRPCAGEFDAERDTTYIWNTLGMSGRWLKKDDGYARIKFNTSKGDFFFCDVRNFGTMHFDRSFKQTEKKVLSLGVDLLVRDVSLLEFKARLMRRAKKSIVAALMDQSVTAGVGNYIKCEALYLSGISPHRQTQSLTDEDLERLLASLKHVMRSSFEAKGHSMSDYVGVDGQVGSYSFRLRVYNRATDPNGRPVKREMTDDGRTTHWVPELQR